MRLIVSGSRTFSDFKLLCEKLDHYTAKLDKTKLTVLSGHANGADKLGERWCDEHYIKYEIWRADWTRHGKAAGPIRNEKMCQSKADACIVFWDGASPGSANMIALAKQYNLKLRVIRF